MALFTIIKHVESTPDRVFEVFTDVSKLAERIEGITRVEVLTDGPVGQGTRFRETRIMFKKEATEEMEFTTFDPPSSFTLGCESCGCRYETVHRFLRKGSGTLVEVAMAVQPLTFFAKLFSPLGRLMSGSMKKLIAKELEQLKAVAEATPPATAG